jgi:hypothetical protein
LTQHQKLQLACNFLKVFYSLNKQLIGAINIVIK